MTSNLLELTAREDELLEKHIQRCQELIEDCAPWSAAQAEWSRARDALLDYRDDLIALRVRADGAAL